MSHWKPVCSILVAAHNNWLSIKHRLMVVKENAGDIIFTDEFERCKNRHNLDVYVCRKHDPQSKGMVESGVKFVKYNFARNRTFINLEQWETGFSGLAGTYW